MKWGKITLVIFGALIITALGIDAADTMQGSQSTLLSQVLQNQQGKCPTGMQEKPNATTFTCVDMYEASAGDACPTPSPEQGIATQKNLEQKDCIPQSKKDSLPWRFVTRDQAMQLCAKAGKRLPTSEEWYTLSLGMVDVEGTCNVDSKQIAPSGSFSQCTSPDGAFDIVGNAWEWVSDDVINGMHNAVLLPDSGYVSQVDGSGIATVVQDDPNELFGKDYFWSKKDGAYGLIRGGYYDSGSDGGIYTIHAGTLPTTASAGIGFRCVK